MIDAKEHLKEMKFVGFYENLLFDFEELHRQVYPNVSDNWLLRLLFNMGTMFGFFRMMNYSMCLK